MVVASENLYGKLLKKAFSLTLRIYSIENVVVKEKGEPYTLKNEFLKFYSFVDHAHILAV